MSASDHRSILPVSDDRPQATADQQFAHGLLEHLHRDDRAAQQGRIAEVMRAVRRPEGHDRRLVARRTSWRSALAAAATIVLIAALVTLVLPAEQPAYAMVQASLDAERTAGNRRYAIRVVPRGDTPAEQRTIAELDIADRRHVVIRAAMHRDQRIVIGRNPDGGWSIRPDGTVVRFQHRRARPRWIAFQQTSVLIESVDDLLERLRRDYRLNISDEEPRAALDGTPTEHIVATREDRTGFRPDRIDLWIHRNTRIVQHMELQWHGDGPMHRKWRADRRDGDDHERRQQRRELFREKLRQRMNDRAADGDDRQTGRDSDSAFRDRWRGARAERKRGPVDAPPSPPPPPRFVEGPPRFRDGHHPPPPRVVVFELIDTPTFPDGWFEPEAHAPTD